MRLLRHNCFLDATSISQISLNSVAYWLDQIITCQFPCVQDFQLLHITGKNQISKHSNRRQPCCVLKITVKDVLQKRPNLHTGPQVCYKNQLHNLKLHKNNRVHFMHKNGQGQVPMPVKLIPLGARQTDCG